MEITLSENYRRVFRSIALLLEERLLQMELTLLKFQFDPRVNIVWQDDMAREEKQEVAESIMKMYALLHEFSSHYQLDGKKVNLRKQMNIHNTFLWEDLHNAKSQHIKGYGKINEPAMKELDEFVDKMLTLSDHITSICQQE